jgi:hypothetical protein
MSGFRIWAFYHAVGIVSTLILSGGLELRRGLGAIHRIGQIETLLQVIGHAVETNREFHSEAETHELLHGSTPC